MSENPPPELCWVREERPAWDADKQRIIGDAPDGAFALTYKDGDGLPGDWWSARTVDGTVVGDGRLDTTRGGDAEILLAVAPDRQETGIGSYVLHRLEDEAAVRDINYLHNRIREHPKRDFVHDWLVVRGFRGPVDGDLRKQVGTSRTTRPGTPPPADGRYNAAHDPSGQAPGREEQGGYVDVEQHQY